MSKKVVVYSSPMCHFCHLLEDWLTEKKIDFEKKDVSKDEAFVKELMSKSHQMGVPVTIITNKKGEETIIVGFDQEKLKKAL